MTLANPSKALIALVALVLISGLMAIEAIDNQTGMPVFTMIVGYAVGNGIAAKRGDQVTPIIGTKGQP
jgi:hypothetical protein